MKSKRVSFEMAKNLKKVGYPQDYSDAPFYTGKGMLKYSTNVNLEDNPALFCSAPTITDVWYWIWEEKRIFINPDLHFDSIRGYYFTTFATSGVYMPCHQEGDSLDEALERTIRYLIDCNSLK